MMKNMLKMCLFLMATLMSDQAIAAGIVQSRVSNGIACATWNDEDPITFQPTCDTIFGPVGNNPSTWTSTRLNTSTQWVVTAPFITSNTLGDMVVLFEFYDSTNASYHVLAGMLPSGTSTWDITIVSNDGTFPNMGDQTASIDELGNVLATWTTFNPNTSLFEVRCSTSVISTTPTWTAPSVISQ